ncbi:MAG TPA: response regulator [Thermoplasmata archaeon]|jgi:CheY-like chemotaxis protein|nr:response regulator [Thermoplasmata archaeon]
MGRSGRLQVLVVDDSPADVRLIQEAMRASSIQHDLNVVWDGEQAIAYLRRSAPFSSAPRPQLILLDLNMPRKDGRAVLREIKADEELRKIPVVVLSSSGSPDDIAGSYDAHANCYLRKPVDFDQFRGLVRQIETFWLTAAELPDS